MSKVDEIKNQLAQRLEKQSTKAAHTVSLETTSTPPSNIPSDAHPIGITGKDAANAANKSKTKGTAIAKMPVAAGVSEGVIKLSASLYSYDVDCLDRIREFMRKNGVRNITDSEAIRLACRAVQINDQFLKIYQEMSKEDGRRRKGQ